MNRNPGYRHLLLGAAALFTLSAVLPLACAEPEADLTAAGGSTQEAGPEGGKDAAPDAPKGGSGGSAGKGGSGTGGASGKGGSSGTGGSSGSGYGGYAGSGTGGDSGAGGGSSGGGGASGGGGSAMYAKPLGEGEQSCGAGQIFIFGNCFP